MHVFQVSFIKQPKQRQQEQGHASNKIENKVNFPYLMVSLLRVSLLPQPPLSLSMFLPLLLLSFYPLFLLTL